MKRPEFCTGAMLRHLDRLYGEGAETFGSTAAIERAYKLTPHQAAAVVAYWLHSRGNVTTAPTPPTVETLKAARVAKALTLSTIADRLQLPAVTIQAVENGELAAGPELLSRWSKVIEDAADPRPWYGGFRRRPRGRR
jgi:hypothetical protein